MKETGPQPDFCISMRVNFSANLPKFEEWQDILNLGLNNIGKHQRRRRCSYFLSIIIFLAMQFLIERVDWRSDIINEGT